VNGHAGQSAAILGRIEAEFGRKRLETLLDLLEDLHKLDLRDSSAAAGHKTKGQAKRGTGRGLPAGGSGVRPAPARMIAGLDAIMGARSRSRAAR
jgi:hypothetical protein